MAIPGTPNCKHWKCPAERQGAEAIKGVYRHNKSVNINPLSPHGALKHHVTSLKAYLIFPTTKDFIMKIYMKPVYQYMAIFLNFHPLQVQQCPAERQGAEAIKGVYRHNKSVNINHLSPHGALKHHVTSLKTYLISLQRRIL